jgi:two-component system OmpR family response regulator
MDSATVLALNDLIETGMAGFEGNLDNELANLKDELRRVAADDLAKPFALVEFVALEALLRRPVKSRETLLRVGPLDLDRIERTAQRSGHPIDLLPREFRLLEYMMRHEGETVTRAMLFEDVWNYRFTPESNLVDVHMGRLRRKIDRPDEAPMIHSVRGAGFVLRAPI